MTSIKVKFRPSLVRFGRSHPAVLFELYYRAFHKIEQGVFLGIAVELVDHIICSIGHTRRGCISAE